MRAGVRVEALEPRTGCVALVLAGGEVLELDRVLLSVAKVPEATTVPLPEGDTTCLIGSQRLTRPGVLTELSSAL